MSRLVCVGEERRERERNSGGLLILMSYRFPTTQATRRFRHLLAQCACTSGDTYIDMHVRRHLHRHLRRLLRQSGISGPPLTYVNTQTYARNVDAHRTLCITYVIRTWF